MPISIAKFGGTSVADFSAMSRCVEIIVQDKQRRVVVVSAPAGVTNRLVTLGSEPLLTEQRQLLIDEIREQVTGILDACEPSTETTTQLEQLLTELEEISAHPSLQFNTQLKDELLSFGERFSSLLITRIFNQSGYDAINFDVRNVMLTNSDFGQAVPDIQLLHKQAQKLLKPLLDKHIVVTQGFIGRNQSGKTTTLGRGGSDFTAALLAEALEANRCEIWTDVAGVYSTDPRLVEEAFPLHELSYDEAAEMANFGAKVLHPATLAPTLRANIPVFVGSSKAPDAGGTLIVKDCEKEPPFRAITRRREQDLVTLRTPQAKRTSGFMGQVFNLLDEHGLSIDLITTSETAISLTFNDPVNTSLAQLNQQVIEVLQELAEVSIDEDLDLITLVGNHLHENTGVTSTIFAALADFKIRMIGFGANPHNLSFLVDKADSDEVIKVLHQKLF